jgi:hypothetical protein
MMTEKIHPTSLPWRSVRPAKSLVLGPLHIRPLRASRREPDVSRWGKGQAVARRLAATLSTLWHYFGYGLKVK